MAITISCSYRNVGHKNNIAVHLPGNVINLPKINSEMGVENMARYSVLLVFNDGARFTDLWTYEFTQFILPSTNIKNNEFLIKLIVSWVTSGIYT